MNDQTLLELVRRADPVTARVGEPPDALLERILVSARAETKPERTRVGRLSGWRVATPRRWKPILVTAVAVAVLAGAGVAIAAGFGAFTGIGAAQHPQSATDIPPAVAALIAQSNKQQEEARGWLLEPDSARFITELPDGARVWVVATTNDQLCSLIQGVPGGSANPNGVGVLECGAPLSPSQPSTGATLRPDPSLPPLSYGVTLDSVTAVSFMAGGKEVTVPVKNNVWSYLGANASINSLTVHFADGSTETIH